MTTDVPSFLAHLPRQGSLLVPWFVHRDKDGRYQFRVRDVAKHERAVRFGLCSICGLWSGGPPYFFQVGPLCLEEGVVFGTPVHERCALAALVLCPFLAQQDWAWGHDRTGATPAGYGTLVPPDELPPKPSRLGLALCEDYEPVRANGSWYAAFSPPTSIRWWVYRDNVLVPEVAV